MFVKSAYLNAEPLTDAIEPFAVILKAPSELRGVALRFIESFFTAAFF